LNQRKKSATLDTAFEGICRKGPETMKSCAALLTLLAFPAAAQDTPSPEAIMQAWLASPHADASAEAFTHWNEEGAVPEDCAVCHSGPGFIDFVGGDGSAAGVVDRPAPIESPISCDACHNDASMALTSVTFPSGVVVEDLGSSASCATCHQGRESTDSVDEATGGIDEDAVSDELGFVNVHYRAAAATWLGGAVRGGYQYAERDYAGRFAHVPNLDTCAGCHDPHASTVAEETCLTCHEGANALAEIRTTTIDVDGDGDTSEGIAAEVDTLHERLLVAIQTYAAEVAGTPIAYDPLSYPYFFSDTDGDGAAGADEAAYPNRYQSWTPRLLRAAYNYQFVAKDPGGFAHNPHYVLQLIYDSLESLSEQVDVEMAGLTRP
jgi:hypothetical protein